MSKALLKKIAVEAIKLKWSRKQVRFLDNSVIDSMCSFEGNNSIGANTRLSNCLIGRGTYTGSNVDFTSVEVGRFCSVGSFIKNTTGRHPVTGFVSTHPAFFSTGKAAGFTFSTAQRFEEVKYSKHPYLVTIGNDVWIGDNVWIQDGVTIGDGAVIGTNSLVTKDIEPYSINIGSPSKIVKYRFDEDTIAFLLKFKWWDKDFEWIRKNQPLFADINRFKSEFSG